MRDWKDRRLDFAYLSLRAVRVRSEGLIVLMCDLLRPMISNGVHVVLHTTDRHHESVTDALSANGIDLHSVDIRAYPIGSTALAWIDALYDPPPRRRRNSALRRTLRTARPRVGRLMEQASRWTLDPTLRSNLPRLLLGLLLLPVAVLLAATSLLLAAAAGLIAGVAFLGKRYFALAVEALRTRAAFGPLRGVLKPYYRAFKRSCGRLHLSKAVQALKAGAAFDPLRLLRKPLYRAFKRSRGRLQPLMYEYEQRRLAACINRTEDCRTVLFLSTFGGTLLAQMGKPVVLCFPDLVPAIYPTRFASDEFDDSFAHIKQGLRAASVIVCYSDYVRRERLSRFFASEISGKRVEIIPHGQVLLAPDGSRQAALDRLQNEADRIQNIFTDLQRHAPVVSFGEFDYVLYPTIDRPHKNLSTLVRAIDNLLRRRHRNIKLVLTSPELRPEVASLIERLRLQYDVLVMPSLPEDVLNALFKCATVAVHASLSEGELPFTFSKAVSSGCPALLPDIEVVREAFARVGVSESEYRDWLFDTVDADALADLIDAVCGRREMVAQSQADALKKLAAWSFTDCANAYLTLCEEVYESSSNSRL